VTSVRTSEKSACKTSAFLEAADDRRTASPESVRPDADEQGDCRDQKDLQIAAFLKRLMGFEPSTFCMASSTSASEIVPKCLQIHGISGPHAGMGFQELRRNAGGLDKERTMRTSWDPLDPAGYGTEGLSFES
jgi:hypothetical protein